MFEYFHPGELKFFGNDFALIDSAGLKKKMCRYMIEILEKHYPDKDFSSYKIRYAKGKDLKSEVTWALWRLWEQYLTLQDKKTQKSSKQVSLHGLKQRSNIKLLPDEQWHTLVRLACLD